MLAKILFLIGSCIIFFAAICRKDDVTTVAGFFFVLGSVATLTPEIK